MSSLRSLRRSTRVLLASTAVLAAAAFAAPAALNGILVNPSFSQDLDGWTHDGAASGFGVSGRFFEVSVVDPPVPEMDDAAAELHTACFASGGFAPLPCSGPEDGQVLEGCVDSVAHAEAELYQVVRDIRSTALEFEVAAQRQLIHSGTVVTGSEMFVEVVQLHEQATGQENVIRAEYTILPSLEPETFVPCDSLEQKDSREFTTVHLDLAKAGFHRGDTVLIRVLSALDVQVFGCRSLANATIRVWVDNFRFLRVAGG